jgi:caspase 6
MSRDVYQINYSRPGLVLIFNNNNFRQSLQRTGSEEDVRRLEYVFKSVLNFEVRTFKDKNRRETREIIENFAAEDFTKDSCLICFFMSHGNRHTFVTSDDKEISIDDLSGPFKKVRSLKDKPKLFFFQCCRGTEEMAQIDSRQRIASSNPMHHDNSSIIRTDVTETDGVPVEADVLYGYSTVEKFYSYRHPIFGSWFIQTICEIICKNPCIEIKDLQNKINKRMKEKELAISQFNSQLVADLYLKDPNKEPRNVHFYSVLLLEDPVFGTWCHRQKNFFKN